MTHPDDQPGRFGQCTETCTTDCGHCKGRPVEELRATLRTTERLWAHARIAAERAEVERDNALAEVARHEREANNLRVMFNDEVRWRNAERDRADALAARLERAEKVVEAMQPVVDAAVVFVTEDDPTSAQIDALAKAVDFMPWNAHREPSTSEPTP